MKRPKKNVLENYSKDYLVILKLRVDRYVMIVWKNLWSS